LRWPDRCRPAGLWRREASNGCATSVLKSGAGNVAVQLPDFLGVERAEVYAALPGRRPDGDKQEVAPVRQEPREAVLPACGGFGQEAASGAQFSAPEAPGGGRSTA